MYVPVCMHMCLCIYVYICICVFCYFELSFGYVIIIFLSESFTDTICQIDFNQNRRGTILRIVSKDKCEDLNKIISNSNTSQTTGLPKVKCGQ